MEFSDIFKITFLAILQGITEFLPISSSGHLAIFQNIFGIEEDNLLLVVVLHAGTLISIILYYFKDILALFRPGSRHLIGLIFLGTLPLVIVGILIKPILEDHFNSLWLVSICLLFTAAILLLLHNGKPKGKTLQTMGIKEAMIIGCFQCIAILPGVSRSGSTISIATRLGITHKDAATFSFFLGIPGILGAITLTSWDMIKSSETVSSTTLPISLLVWGFFLSFIVGYYSLKVLIHILEKNKFSSFGYYCLVLSCTIILVKWLGNA